MSISIADITIPKKKYELVKQAEADVDTITHSYMRGELTDEERYNNVIAIWDQATKDVVAALQDSFDDYNPIKMMSDSGARGNITQMRQLAGMRGLMSVSYTHLDVYKRQSLYSLRPYVSYRDS